jgi:hypothetical protein
MVFCGGGGRLSQPGHDAFRNLAQVDGARAVRRDFEGAQRARAADEAPRPAQPGAGHDSAPHGSYQTEDLSEPELRPPSCWLAPRGRGALCWQGRLGHP